MEEIFLQQRLRFDTLLQVKLCEVGFVCLESCVILFYYGGIGIIVLRKFGN